MTEPRAGGERGSEAASYQLSEAGGDGLVELAATGSDAEALLRAGLRGIVATARGDWAPAGEDEAGSAAAPIRGQGATLEAVFAELAADLLAQLDANGPGLNGVRLDGLLTTDDGGYTAWGYATGTAADNPPPIGLSLDGDPRVTEADGRLALRCNLRRG